MNFTNSSSSSTHSPTSSFQSPTSPLQSPTSSSLILMTAGLKRSGKSTVANHIHKTYPSSIELTFAESLKKTCQHVFLLSHEQLYDETAKEIVDPRWGVSPRVLFQRIGDLFRDHLKVVLPELTMQEPTIFIENMRYRILTAQEQSKSIINVSDGRFADENEFIKKMGGVTVKIERPIVDSSVKKDNHASEQIPFTCDHCIVNNASIKNLEDEIDDIILICKNTPSH